MENESKKLYYIKQVKANHFGNYSVLFLSQLL